jgi:predicted  nucleic acid-binding Zn-ribbon protein
MFYRALKKLEIQMNSTNSSCEQQERLLEPLQIKMEELSEKNHKRQEDLASLTTEVEALRKTVAQQVNIMIYRGH